MAEFLVRFLLSVKQTHLTDAHTECKWSLEAWRHRRLSSSHSLQALRQTVALVMWLWERSPVIVSASNPSRGRESRGPTDGLLHQESTVEQRSNEETTQDASFWWIWTSWLTFFQRLDVCHKTAQNFMRLFFKSTTKKCQGEPPTIIFSIQACFKLNCPTTKRIQSNVFFYVWNSNTTGDF